MAAGTAMPGWAAIPPLYDPWSRVKGWVLVDRVARHEPSCVGWTKHIRPALADPPPGAAPSSLWGALPWTATCLPICSALHTRTAGCTLLCSVTFDTLSRPDEPDGQEQEQAHPGPFGGAAAGGVGGSSERGGLSKLGGTSASRLLWAVRTVFEVRGDAWHLAGGVFAALAPPTTAPAGQDRRAGYPQGAAAPRTVLSPAGSRLVPTCLLLSSTYWPQRVHPCPAGLWPCQPLLCALLPPPRAGGLLPLAGQHVRLRLGAACWRFGALLVPPASGFRLVWAVPVPGGMLATLRPLRPVHTAQHEFPQQRPAPHSHSALSAQLPQPNVPSRAGGASGCAGRWRRAAPAQQAGARQRWREGCRCCRRYPGRRH